MCCRAVSMPEPVSSVSCGGHHTVALTSSGKLYSFGLSSNGQLGLGNRILESSTPHPLAALQHTNISRSQCANC